MSRLDKYFHLYVQKAASICRAPDNLRDHIADPYSPEGLKTGAFCLRAACKDCAWVEHQTNQKILELILNQLGDSHGP